MCLISVVYSQIRANIEANNARFEQEKIIYESDLPAAFQEAEDVNTRC